MSKQEFLAQLKKGLFGLPQNDIEERLTFYSEMIDDRMEEGLTEEAAVGEIGAVDDIVSQIVSETPLSKLVKEKARPTRALRVWEIVLLILGSPIWLSLLIAAFAVILAAFVVVWVVIASLWAIEASLAACSLGAVVAAMVFVLSDNALIGVAILGAGLVCGGTSILFFFGCKLATKGFIQLTKKMVLGSKFLFLGKVDVK